MTTKPELLAALQRARSDLESLRIRLQGVVGDCEGELEDLATDVDTEVVNAMIDIDDALRGALRRLEA